MTQTPPSCDHLAQPTRSHHHPQYRRYSWMLRPLRLSEDASVSVLVLKRGHVEGNLVSRVLLMSQNFWMGDPLQARRRFTEPMPKVNDRRNGI
ncbi:hypothetical protein B0H66DRAFT_632229 [Apodospora peruviana]|uniref:Uncharacterized protein n=1 Tax=Apodospora peruviana TaxID=516989 RepID=A0AAE0HV35_9PEZI|nr:hypothetical protein B0H66DRAFT_632229 [Apodospora peruviana]